MTTAQLIATLKLLPPKSKIMVRDNNDEFEFPIEDVVYEEGWVFFRLEETAVDIAELLRSEVVGHGG